MEIDRTLTADNMPAIRAAVKALELYLVSHDYHADARARAIASVAADFLRPPVHSKELLAALEGER